MIGLPPYQTWGGFVPQLPEPLAQWVPQRVKVKKFIPPVGAVADVKRLPCHISQFAPTIYRGSPKRVKMENFLYILRSSGPRRVHRHQCYTTYWGRSWCKKSTLPYLPIYPYISQGAKSAAHTRMNLESRHISETITGRKLKFYTHRQGKVLFQGMKIFPTRVRAAGAAPPSVNVRPLISRKPLELEG